MSTQLKAKDKGQIIQNKIDERVVSPKRKNTITLEAGKNATTMQGGYEVPIMFKEVLAGEYIESWRINNLTRIITPLVPTLDKIFITFKAFFVPHTAIWEKAEEVIAAKTTYETEGDTDYRILPSTNLKAQNTSNPLFKYHLASRYGIPNKASDTRINMLLLRGYRKIENDYLTIKDYEIKKVEWNTINVGTAEQSALNWLTGNDNTIDLDDLTNEYVITKSKARKNYYTDLRRTMGDPIVIDEELNSETMNMYEHLDWQAKYNNVKQNVLNSEKNDWDIIAEMGGTKPVRADRVEFLGELDYELNYQQITQTSPTMEESGPLGTAGSFSYTKAMGEIFSHKQFEQHGFIHIIANVNMEQFFEAGTPKELMKTKVNEIYRPTLSNIEVQTMYEKEVYNGENSQNTYPIAFQPPYSEYKRLPTIVSGEMQTTRLLKGSAAGSKEPISNSQWHNIFAQKGGRLQVVSENYFKPANYVNATLARNNVANLTFEGENHVFTDDPILNMSEHMVKVSTPIERYVISGTDQSDEVK